MRKNKKIKDYSKVHFETLQELKRTYYNVVNQGRKKNDPLLTWKDFDRVFNKNTITASSVKGYSHEKAQKKLKKELKKKGLTDTEINKKLSSGSRSTLFKQMKHKIFDNWELGKNDPQLLKNFNNLFKIARYIELNAFSIFHSVKLITDANGRKYTFLEALNPTQDSTNQFRNLLINIDDVALAEWAKLKNLKRAKNIIWNRIKKEKGNLGTFGFNFTDGWDFTKSDEEIQQELDSVEAYYFNKEGMEYNTYTEFFKITNLYIDSENAVASQIEFVNEHAAEKLAKLLVQDQERAIELVNKDLADYPGIVKTLFEILIGNNPNAGKKHLGTDYENLNNHILGLVNVLNEKIKGE